MNPMHPLVMIDQAKDLGNVLREQTKPIDRLIRNALTPLEFRSLHRVYTTGDGDSYHAAMAGEMAFEQIARIACEPMSAMRFLEYGAEYLPSSFPNDTLVVGISATGGTKRVAQALERAHQASKKVITMAISGNVAGIVGQSAGRKISVQLPDMGRSPGVRTYNASLMALILLAIRIGEINDRYHQSEANAMRKELIALADVAEATCAAMLAPAQEAAKALKDASYLLFVGSGPSYGTALFSAAKVVEASGLMAMGQDLEEWAHVERFTYPDDTPLFIIAPPGKGYWRAVELAKSAKELGRRLIAVVNREEEVISGLADFVLPVTGDVREEFSPLIYHIAADLFASYLAEELARNPFQTNRPEVLARWAAMFSAHRPQPETSERSNT
jgi:glucosamine--fructose-6-phosphate aminotransferase (isomerizing)